VRLASEIELVAATIVERHPLQRGTFEHFNIARVSGAEMTTTNTLRHALMLVEHDGLSAAILDIPWATVTVRTFARDSRIAASPSSSIAGSLKSKARVTGHRISTNRRPPRSWLPQWKACSGARRFQAECGWAQKWAPEDWGPSAQ